MYRMSSVSSIFRVKCVIQPRLKPVQTVVGRTRQAHQVALVANVEREPVRKLVVGTKHYPADGMRLGGLRLTIAYGTAVQEKR